MLPFHTKQKVVGGYCRNADGSIDQASTDTLVKAIGHFTPEEFSALPKGEKDRKKKQSKW
jgi:hypothetical protein